MPIGGTCTERTIQATDFSDHRFWRKSSELCFRLGGEILRVLYDVINDVTNDVIFYLKKLILKPFLHIKGSKYESSRYNIYERALSGLSKNRSRFPNRPSWAELLVGGKVTQILLRAYKCFCLKIGYHVFITCFKISPPLFSIFIKSHWATLELKIAQSSRVSVLKTDE